jgi:Putative DNA-binding domain
MTPVDVDFHKDDLASPKNNELYAAIEVFTRMASPQTEPIQEGYLLDFKEGWSDSALKTAAAFANTLGGLSLIDVSEKDGRADRLVGVPSQRHELKTQIASAITSNISPTPSYEIRDVAFPDSSGRHLCIVRLRKANSIIFSPRRMNRRFTCVMETRASAPMPHACRHCLPPVVKLVPPAI